MLPLNTITVGAAVTPTIIETWFAHYLNRKPLRQKPTAHISYDLGLHLVRRFVEYSALHTIEEIQSFTSQWVPAAHWVKTDNVEIPQAKITKAAEYLQAQLGSDGLEQVGGKTWWQWRRDNSPLKAEWIEMRADYHQRKETRDKGRRIMLYVHGGAYYFGSVDEHRYQIQRHARKLKARCLAPRYRLAPQFPFPCGLHDCLAAYLYLLGEYDPTSIVVAGDSAGGGMVLSLLVLLRDQGIPLPAGGILLSPWVDLMHSFPSLAGDGKLDYIPSNGFIHKPSMGWPPPTIEDVKDESMPSGVAAAKPLESSNQEDGVPSAEKSDEAESELEDARRGFSVVDPSELAPDAAAKIIKEPEERYRSNMTGRIETSAHIPSVMIDGKIVQIRDQIQMYAPNHLLTHPLVSPALQPSLGGLCPLLIQVGGGEMLRDEQVYVGHKAANPSKYPPSDEILDQYDPDRKQLSKYKPTDVQLQFWDDVCHVGHTLSWTRPAKYMYRSVAQFGAWALARAQNRAIDIPEDDSSDSETDSSPDDGNSKGMKKIRRIRSNRSSVTNDMPAFAPVRAGGRIGRAGDPLPPFIDHMIRQRVDRHGNVYELAPPGELPGLCLKPKEIGVLKEAPVRKWLNRQEKWNRKFASTKRELQKKRAKQLEDGYVGIPEGEKPPPTALAGRRTKDLPKLAKIRKSYGMSLWSLWGSKHDQLQVQREQAAEDLQEIASRSGLSPTGRKSRQRARSNSQHRPAQIRSVVDEGQIKGSIAWERPRTAPHPESHREVSHTRWPSAPTNGGMLHPNSAAAISTVIPPSNTTSTRPTHDGIAYPFKLKLDDTDSLEKNPSMMTLESENAAISLHDGGSTLPESRDGAASKIDSSYEEIGEKVTDTNEIGAIGKEIAIDGKKVDGRPPIERFVTAAEEL